MRRPPSWLVTLTLVLFILFGSLVGIACGITLSLGLRKAIERTHQELIVP